jgi:hypothetical protein
MTHVATLEVGDDASLATCGEHVTGQECSASSDTADIYSQGESEVIVGKALADGRRDDVVLATKVWGKMGEDTNQGIDGIAAQRSRSPGRRYSAGSRPGWLRSNQTCRSMASRCSSTSFTYPRAALAESLEFRARACAWASSRLASRSRTLSEDGS